MWTICCTPSRHTGQLSPSRNRRAQESQKLLWPHGRSAWVASPTVQIAQAGRVAADGDDDDEDDVMMITSGGAAAGWLTRAWKSPVQRYKIPHSREMSMMWTLFRTIFSTADTCKINNSPQCPPRHLAVHIRPHPVFPLHDPRSVRAGHCQVERSMRSAVYLWKAMG